MKTLYVRLYTGLRPSVASVDCDECKEKFPNILCMGYQQQAGGEIIVDKVLTFKLPPLTDDEIASFSEELERFLWRRHRKKKKPEPSLAETRFIDNN